MHLSIVGILTSLWSNCCKTTKNCFCCIDCSIRCIPVASKIFLFFFSEKLCHFHKVSNEFLPIVLHALYLRLCFSKKNSLWFHGCACFSFLATTCLRTRQSLVHDSPKIADEPVLSSCNLIFWHVNFSCHLWVS